MNVLEERLRFKNMCTNCYFLKNMRKLGTFFFYRKSNHPNYTSYIRKRLRYSWFPYNCTGTRGESAAPAIWIVSKAPIQRLETYQSFQSAYPALWELTRGLRALIQRTGYSQHIHFVMAISEFAQTPRFKMVFGLKLASYGSVWAHIRNRRDNFSRRVWLWGLEAPEDS